VSFQGILGILRVSLNAPLGPELAMVHGSFAQLTFAMLISVAVMTSPAWLRECPAEFDRPGLRHMSLVLVGLVYLQVFFGAVVRHLREPWAQRAHVLFAFVVAGTVLWLVMRIKELANGQSGAKRWIAVLTGLVGVELLLGVEAWLGRFGSGAPAELVRSTTYLDFVRSAHFLIGLLIFSTTIILTLVLHRAVLQGWMMRRARAPWREEAA
jgi:heme a synthase